MLRRVGVLLVGQSPRADLLEEIGHLAPRLDLVQAGALDGLSREHIAAAPVQLPLIARLRDGSAVIVDRDFVGRRMQVLIDQMGSEVDAFAVLCTEDFTALRAPVPLLLPYSIGCGFFTSLGFDGRLGVVCPVQGQVGSSRERWRARGYEAVFEVASPFEPDALRRAATKLAAAGCGMVVLDCAGYGREHARALASITHLPVVSLRSLMWSVLALL